MWKITENIFALQKQHHKETIFTIGNGCLCTHGGSGVHAWELGEALDPGRLDTKRYFKLLDRALQTVLDPCRRSCVSERLL
ncbi:MAG: hypothetical protein HUU11_15695 [Anaerolineales bacterium]|nr:hypothetical protein [Anaerolineales bacterium]